MLPLSVGTVACDRVPARNTLGVWPPGEPVLAGSCEFLLQRAAVYHSTEWHLEVEVVARNAGRKSAYCAFSAQLMTSSDTVLTDAAQASGDLEPKQEWTREAASREANETGMSTGQAEGAWVYVKLSDGHWPLQTTTGVVVSPERVRPPG